MVDSNRHRSLTVTGRRASTAAACLWVMVLLVACGSQFPGASGPAAGASRDTSASPHPAPDAGPTGAVPAKLCTSSQVPFPKRLVSAGSYSIEPDQWNASGIVCLDTPGDTGFTVSAVQAMTPKTAGTPGAYPNIAAVSGTLGLPVPVSALGDATSEWSASARASGSYDMAYDLWYGPSATNCDPASSAELMVWLDATDNVEPAGTKTSVNVVVGDATYAVYQAPITTAHSVISYIRTTPTHTAHRLDLRLFTQDALLRGYVPAGSYLCKVSAGFEIWSGGVGLRTWSFAFNNAVGLPRGAVISGAPGICLVRRSAGTAAGAPVTGPCGGQGATTWTLANDGTVRADGYCLEASGSGGTALALAACTGGVAQRWSSNQDHQLVNGQSGNCLGTAGGSLAVGVAAELQPCRGGSSQHWRLPYNGLS
ncbi:hypothetical protein ABIA33_004044 [Streptacidiphilus sp. MAP12-16]